uniref:Uncharacterized protein n=1 Tax=Romanomermis culicivorax TaxID=13658 RepID=A0A915JID4_ROMCU
MDSYIHSRAHLDLDIQIQHVEPSSDVQIDYIAATINGTHMDTRNYIKAKRSKLYLKGYKNV